MSSLSTLQRLFSGKRLVFPIGLGLALALYFLFRNFDPRAFDSIQWSLNVLWWFLLALGVILLRLAGYMYRLRVLSDNQISWKSSFHIIVLWEFASAITPGVVGGTAAAFVLLAQEKKINTGKSTAIVIATSYLDVLFYVLCIPALLLFTSLSDQIPGQIGPISGDTFKTYFLIAYSVFVLWTLTVYIGLFKKPEIIGTAIRTIFKLPFLRRWKTNANQWSDELVVASNEFKLKPRTFWIKAFWTTIVAWVARFALANFLILALGNGVEFLSIFIKQVIMWGGLMVPITPGASGIAELLFSSFLGDYFSSPSLADTTSVIWRLVSYYPYLIAGVIVFPIWIRLQTKNND